MFLRDQVALSSVHFTVAGFAPHTNLNIWLCRLGDSDIVTGECTPLAARDEKYHLLVSDCLMFPVKGRVANNRVGPMSRLYSFLEHKRYDLDTFAWPVKICTASRGFLNNTV